MKGMYFIMREDISARKIKTMLENQTVPHLEELKKKVDRTLDIVNYYIEGLRTQTIGLDSTIKDDPDDPFFGMLEASDEDVIGGLDQIKPFNRTYEQLGEFCGMILYYLKELDNSYVDYGNAPKAKPLKIHSMPTDESVMKRRRRRR